MDGCTRIVLYMCFAIPGLVCKISCQRAPLKVRMEGARYLETGIHNWTIIKKTGMSYQPSIECISDLDEEKDVCIIDGEGQRIDALSLRDIEVDMHNLTCHLNTTKPVDGHTYVFTMDGSIAVNIVEGDVSFCAASVGNSGFIGEFAQIYCYGRGNGWEDSGDSNKYVSLSHDQLSPLSCGREQRNGWRETCNVAYLLPLEEVLKLNITPTSYSSGNSSLYFACESTPPRLIFWQVIGTNGDLLDNNYALGSIRTDTNITITQKRGFSELYIDEKDAGANSIHTVRCYTYDTMRAVSEARVMTKTPTTQMQEDVRMSVIQGGHIEVTDRSNYPNGRNQSRERVSSGVIVVIILFILIILCMGSVIIFMYYKMKQTERLEAPDSGKEIGNLPMTQLHSNLAYKPSGNITTDAKATTFDNRKSTTNDLITPGAKLEDNPAYEASGSDGDTSVPSSATSGHEYTYIAP